MGRHKTAGRGSCGFQFGDCGRVNLGKRESSFGGARGGRNGEGEAAGESEVGDVTFVCKAYWPGRAWAK